MRIALSALVALGWASTAVAQKLSDADIRCYSAETCQVLTGKRVWIKDSSVQACPKASAAGCKRLPIGTSFVIVGVIDDAIAKQFRIRTDAGLTGYVSVANAHLLTFRDPRPAAKAATKRKAAESEAKARQQAEDEKALAAMSQGDLQKGCILAAAERLPRIPGIQIINSRISAMPSETKIEPGTYMTLVHIDAKAAGQDVTYNFLCARGARTPSIVQRLGD
jgi:hypothetical protein